MSVIKADVEVCQGYANCVVAAADVFDIGDTGTVVILDDTVTESAEARIVTAIRQLSRLGFTSRNDLSETAVNVQVPAGECVDHG